jgi:CubicO group peptidase (beta-lactamase class C family)
MRYGPLPSRRAVTQSMLLGASAALLSPSHVLSQTPAVPGANWDTAPGTPQAKFANLDAVEDKLFTMTTTSFMVVTGGRISYRYGEIGEVSYLASARKSIMSMLYGKYVANGTIKLDATMADIGIDEDDGLLPIEKTARVRDLLISSSGVYHAGGSPGTEDNLLPRGTEQPGKRFVYNTWDFNVLGAIFEKLTGKTVFAALEQDLARPLGFQDYDPARQRMMGYENQSRYLAYHMFLSARDMARLGLLMARNGNWNGQQIVPAAWVKESTTQYVSPGAVGRGGEVGYSYLWWTPTRTGAPWAGSFMASGQFGQYILVLPAIDTVIVHRRAVTDEFAIARNLGKTKFMPPPVTASAFLKVADLLLAPKAG